MSGCESVAGARKRDRQQGEESRVKEERGRVGSSSSSGRRGAKERESEDEVTRVTDNRSTFYARNKLKKTRRERNILTQCTAASTH